MVLITSGSRLRSVVSARHAVIFIHFDWSGQSEESLLIFRDLENLEWNAEERSAFYRIDPEDNHDVWDWISDPRREPHSDLAAGGFGSIVWLRFGEIVDFERYAGDAGVENLTRRTLALFSK
jgi:hypothetical protein